MSISDISHLCVCDVYQSHERQQAPDMQNHWTPIFNQLTAAVHRKAPERA